MFLAERVGFAKVERIRLLHEIVAKSTQKYHSIINKVLDQARQKYDASKFGEIPRWGNLEVYKTYRSTISNKDFGFESKNEHLIPLNDLENISNLAQLEEVIKSALGEESVSLEEVFSNQLTIDKPKFGVFVSPKSIFPNALIVICPGHDQFHHSWELADFILNLVYNFRKKGVDIVVIHNEANQSMRTDHDQLAVIEGFEYRSDFESKYFSMTEESSHNALIARLYDGISQNHSLYSLVYLPDF